MKRILEVCCGSIEDGLVAYANHADRIELNSALSLGGLSPSLASLKTLKSKIDIPIAVMVRSRGFGFHYNQREYEQMILEAKDFLDNGADAIVFGSLTSDSHIDVEQTRNLVALAHSYGKEFVYHGALGCVPDYFEAINTLIDCGVDRILTSGGKPNVSEGLQGLIKAQNEYGDKIQVLAGCGVTLENINDLLDGGLVQIHGTCKQWVTDPTMPNQSFPKVDGEFVNQMAKIIHEY